MRQEPVIRFATAPTGRKQDTAFFVAINIPELN